MSSISRFERLWEGKAEGVTTYCFPDACRNKLIRHAPDRPVEGSYHLAEDHKRGSFAPRACQEAAKEKFLRSGFNCLFMMATGSGKTKAALYAMSEVDSWRLLLICVPSIELVEQWAGDIAAFFPDLDLIRCSSSHPQWKQLLLALIQAKVPRPTIVVTTYDAAISTFSMDKWKSIGRDKLALICDEVHNIGAPSTRKLMELDPAYRIGLSATPERNFDEEGSELILDYFDHQTYEFSIRDALRARYLVEYEYRIIPTAMSDEDWQRYVSYSDRISQLCAREREKAKKGETDRSVQERLKGLYRDRAGIIKKCGAKVDAFDTIFRELPPDSRILIYGDDLDQLSHFKDKLNELGLMWFEYTGDKDAGTVRPIMMQQFRQGVRKILLAVGCLDEGVDIPACDAAIFVSSSTSERQFIQRRGRVLRTAPGKTRAWVYDYLVYPRLDSNTPDEQKDMALSLIGSQYQRIDQIAGDAINGIAERSNLDDFLSKRGLDPYAY